MEQNWITSDDVLGKDVIDIDGTVIGVVDKLFIDAVTLETEAISIDKGFLEKGLVLGKDYIERVSKFAVFLNIAPAILFVKKTVYDASGKRIGVVKRVDVDANTGQIKDIILDSGPIDPQRIAQVGKNITLKE